MRRNELKSRLTFPLSLVYLLSYGHAAFITEPSTIITNVFRMSKKFTHLFQSQLYKMLPLTVIGHPEGTRENGSLDGTPEMILPKSRVVNL